MKYNVIYFTAGKTKTNMLFMGKEQNIYVISLNNTETIQKFWEKWKTVYTNSITFHSKEMNDWN